MTYTRVQVDSIDLSVLMEMQTSAYKKCRKIFYVEHGLTYVEMHPQVQTLLSMLGLQEERVAHPRVRDIDSRYNYCDDNDIEL